MKLDWVNLVSHWNWQQGQVCQVVIFSNCERVELVLNDLLIDERSLSPDDNCRVILEVPFDPGELKVRGYRNAEIVAEDLLRTSGSSCQLKLHHEAECVQSDGLVHVELSLHDENGILCPVSGRYVHLNIEGEGKLSGVSNGDPKSNQLFSSDAVALHDGRALAVIRAKSPGKVIVTATTNSGTQKLEASTTVTITER